MKALATSGGVAGGDRGLDAICPTSPQRWVPNRLSLLWLIDA